VLVLAVMVVVAVVATMQWSFGEGKSVAVAMREVWPTEGRRRDRGMFVGAWGGQSQSLAIFWRLSYSCMSSKAHLSLEARSRNQWKGISTDQSRDVEKHH
jgi:hypothetical protein